MKVFKEALLDEQSRFCWVFVPYIFSAHHCKCLWLNSSKVMLPDRSALLISAKTSSSLTSTFGSGNSQLIFFVLVLAIFMNLMQRYTIFWYYSFRGLCFFGFSFSSAAGCSIVCSSVCWGASSTAAAGGISASTRRKMSSLSVGRASSCHLKPDK